jgi:hypothetical protein
MTEPRTVTPHEEDVAWATAWLRNADAGMEQHLLERRLRRMHERRIGGFRWLVANDARARRIASRLSLLDAGKASWEAIDAIEVRRKIRNVEAAAFPPLLGHFLATALRNHAPHHLGLLPPQWLEDSDDQAATVVPLRAAATPIHAEVRRGPVIEPPDA